MNQPYKASDLETGATSHSAGSGASKDGKSQLPFRAGEAIIVASKVCLPFTYDCWLMKAISRLKLNLMALEMLH